MSFDFIGFKGITSNNPGTWIHWRVFRPTQISDLNNKNFFPKTKTRLFLQKNNSYMIAFIHAQFGAIIFRIVRMKGKFLKMSIFL